MTYDKTWNKSMESFADSEPGARLRQRYNKYKVSGDFVEEDDNDLFEHRKSLINSSLDVNINESDALSFYSTLKNIVETDAELAK